MNARPAAVFLDRDGTINVKAPEGQYVTDPAQLRLLPGAGAAVSRLNRAGIPVAVVTNQRGVARGLMSAAELDSVHARLTELLDIDGAHLDAILHCPHGEGLCACRKPAPGRLLEAARRLEVDDLNTTVMIGDSESDVHAGLAAGARTIRLVPATPAQTAAHVCAPDLAAAVDGLLAP
jgi:D-glycero-D-manno-heptose 1,7-bisphosphate phosphatase